MKKDFKVKIKTWSILLILTQIITNCGIKKNATLLKNTNSKKFIPKNSIIHTQTNKKELGPCEPSIYINPKNPKYIVAGSVVDFVHVSKNGGKTWKTSKLNSKLGVFGDPVITADSNGNFYYFHLSDPEKKGWKSDRILDRIVVQKSTDNGNLWSSGTSIGLNPPKQQDKQWATVNPLTNHIYTTWTEFDKYGSKNPRDRSRILFSLSEDFGGTWTTPLKLNSIDGNCLDDDMTPQGAVPASDGKNLYVAWAYDHKILFSKSEDNGKTWDKTPQEIAVQKAGWSFTIPGVKRANGFPVTGVDISSSKNKGTIYINWSDQITPDNTKVYIIKSTDQGKTWSIPKIVNETKTVKHQFFNWMLVDPITGFLYIVYYEEADTPNLINVKLAVLKDGANSFKHFKINETSFDPRGTNFFGDYNNIDAYNGIIRPIWTQVENGLLSIRTALISQKWLDMK